MEPMRFFLLLFALSLLGCSGLTVPDEPPSVEGTILLWAFIPTPPDVTPGVSIRLQRADPPCDEVTVVVGITEDMLVKRLPNGDLEAILIEDIEDDLAPGRTARAWTVEPVIDCPWSGTARVVEVEVP